MPCSRAMRRATGEALRAPAVAVRRRRRRAARRPRGLGLRRRRGRLGAWRPRGAAGGASLGRAVARRLGLLRRLGRRAVAGRRLAAGADARDDLADGQRVALLGDDRQRAGAVGLVGHRGLVGLDLDELVAAGDLVALGLEPLEDRALLHRVGEARHDDVGHATDATHEPPRVARTSAQFDAASRRVRSSAGIGRAKRKPCPTSQPSASTARRCSVVLDALGHRAQARARGPATTIAPRSSEPWPSPEPGDERAVDLDHVEREAAQVGERRVAGAEVVDGQAHAEVLAARAGSPRAAGPP